ncbi:GH92 family glycosyl hydrolase, partial [Sunxiuqinia dokdonensis]|uniref:GH92 family glycosyl hydrolase n=1 Tax=Sunxiuqinia dokdonensis TaxID=1409788 RepID=UPI000AD1F80C
MKQTLLILAVLISAVSCTSVTSNSSSEGEKKLTSYVNTFLGTAPLTNPKEIGYTPPENWRVWAGLTYPGSSLPNAMVQLSPITEWRSGAGYEYEDEKILAFTHTNKGHWNLCHIPFLPVTGEVDPQDFASAFSHENESAEPGYYQVVLERYNINAELTSTLRVGYHKYTFEPNQPKKLVAQLTRSNERVSDWQIEQQGEQVFQGYQQTGGKIYFYAQTNHAIKNIESKGDGRDEISVVNFEDSDQPLEIKVGLSFVSTENAKENLEAEVGAKSFSEVKNEANQTWENLLSKIQVNGGTERQKELFYSSLYRSFLWPALRSDVNGEFTDESGEVVNKGFRYYTNPSLWDTYRNKLVLLGMLSPDVTNDVIQSLIDKGEKTGFMPTFFHGDHAAPFISGSYLRSIRDYDVKSAYELLMNNATKEGGTRPHILEYIAKGYIS